MARKQTKGVSSAKAARRKIRKRKGAISARRKKEFSFRGYTLEELQKLSLDDVLPLLSSRARRSYQRGLNTEEQAFVDRLMKGDTPVLKTHRREIVRLASGVGTSIGV